MIVKRIPGVNLSLVNKAINNWLKYASDRYKRATLNSYMRVHASSSSSSS